MQGVTASLAFAVQFSTGPKATLTVPVIYSYNYIRQIRAEAQYKPVYKESKSLVGFSKAAWPVGTGPSQPRSTVGPTLRLDFAESESEDKLPMSHESSRICRNRLLAFHLLSYLSHCIPVFSLVKAPPRFLKILQTFTSSLCSLCQIGGVVDLP